MNLLLKLFSPVDPCRKVHCGAGRVCKAEGKIGQCVCITECPKEADPRRRVRLT